MVYNKDDVAMKDTINGGKISYDVQKKWCCYERYYEWVGK